MDDTRDERMIGWLKEGSWAPPEQVLDSAVAYAQAHQRRAIRMPWLRRSNMSRIDLAPVRREAVPHRFPRLTFATIAATMVIAIAVVGATVMLSQRPGDVPAVGGQPSSSADRTAVPTDTATVPPPAGAIVRRGSDALDDATSDAPDIVAVTTIATEDEVLLEVEVADAWTDGSRLWIILETGYGPTPAGGSPFPLSSPYLCWGWVSEAAVETRIFDGSATAVVSGATTDNPVIGTPVNASLDEAVLSVTLPLSIVGDPDALYLTVRSSGRLEGVDWYGDLVGEIPACHRALP